MMNDIKRVQDWMVRLGCISRTGLNESRRRLCESQDVAEQVQDFLDTADDIGAEAYSLRKASGNYAILRVAKDMPDFIIDTARRQIVHPEVHGWCNMESLGRGASGHRVIECFTKNDGLYVFDLVPGELLHVGKGLNPMGYTCSYNDWLGLFTAEDDDDHWLLYQLTPDFKLLSEWHADGIDSPPTPFEGVKELWWYFTPDPSDHSKDFFLLWGGDIMSWSEMEKFVDDNYDPPYDDDDGSDYWYDLRRDRQAESDA